MSPRCAYAVAAGLQHAAAVQAMLRRLVAPVYAVRGCSGPALANEATVVDVGDGDLHAALADAAVDIVFASGPCLDPARLRRRRPSAFVVALGGSERMIAPAHDPLAAEADLVLTATKPFHARLVAQRKALVGSLRHDSIASGGRDRVAPLRHVLWAPGSGSSGSLAAWGPTVVEVTRALGVECWIHPHPASFRREPHLVRWAQAQVLGHEHVTVAHTHELERLMSTTAVLLTDTSSVVWDWLPFDRPTIHLDLDGAVPADYVAFTGGTVASDATQLAAAIGSAFLDPARERARRAVARALVFEALDGRAAARAVDAAWTAYEQRVDPRRTPVTRVEPP